MDELHSASVLSQYLTFQAAGQRYAVGIMKLREILPYAGATKVPMAPGCVRGLINLRGSPVPVVDLAVKLGVGSTPVDKRTCVMIVDPPGGVEGSRAMGILVDSVSAVLELQTDQLEETPSFGTRAPSEYLDGLARVDDEFIPIISLDRILSEENLFAEVGVEETEEEENGNASAREGEEAPSAPEAAEAKPAEIEPACDAEAPAPTDACGGDTAGAAEKKKKKKKAIEREAPAGPSRDREGKTPAGSRKRRSRS